MNKFIELMLRDGRIALLPVGNCTFEQSVDRNTTGRSYDGVAYMDVICNGQAYMTKHTLTEIREELRRLEVY